MEHLKAISAHWFDRPATLRESTEQLLAFLIKLKEFDPITFGGGMKRAGLKNKPCRTKSVLTTPASNDSLANALRMMINILKQPTKHLPGMV